MTKRIGLVIHHFNPDVRDLARQAIEWCGSRVEPSLPKTDADLLERGDLAVAEADFGRELDACLSLGGDGTMLRATGLVSSHGVPILGVNAGHLGYLTEVDPGQMVDALTQWEHGELAIEHRMMLDLFTDGGRTWVGRALNEIVMERSEAGRAVEVGVAIGGQPFLSLLADGVIVATPTGSTAYSLSAGGPIVEPDFKALLLTGVAVHGVFNRPLVLAPDTEVELTVDGHRPAAVTLDGRRLEREFSPGESITCRVSDQEVGFLVRGDRDFHLVLKEKFGLSDR
ncbi:MAG: NAD(+)/NADH kinase [Acidimicrobiales bacterium]